MKTQWINLIGLFFLLFPAVLVQRDPVTLLVGMSSVLLSACLFAWTAIIRKSKAGAALVALSIAALTLVIVDLKKMKMGTQPTGGAYVSPAGETSAHP